MGRRAGPRGTRLRSALLEVDSVELFVSSPDLDGFAQSEVWAEVIGRRSLFAST